MNKETRELCEVALQFAVFNLGHVPLLTAITKQELSSPTDSEIEEAEQLAHGMILKALQELNNE